MASVICGGSAHADAREHNNSPPDTWACAWTAPGSSHQGTDKPCHAARRRSHLTTGCDERSNPLAVSYSIALISSSRAALVKEDQECWLKRVAPQGYFCRFYLAVSQSLLARRRPELKHPRLLPHG